MKKKDLTYLIIAVVILLVAGYIAYTQLFKASADKDKGTEVEVVGVIPSSVDASIVDQLADPTKVKDFTPAVDLTGLGNAGPFGNGQ